MLFFAITFLFLATYPTKTMSSSIVVEYEILKNHHTSEQTTHPSEEIVYEYDDCGCKNSGICTLNGDFCVCKPGFTGRFCELELADRVNRCGPMLNNEYVYLDCAKCTCEMAMLNCEAIKADTCNFNQFKSELNLTKHRTDLNNLESLKRLKLSKLVQLMNLVENHAYQYLIERYQNHFNYQVVYVDLNESSAAKRHFQTLNSGRERRDRVVVFTNGQKISGMHFPLSERDTDTSRAVSKKHEMNTVLTVFFILIFFIFSYL